MRGILSAPNNTLAVMRGDRDELNCLTAAMWSLRRDYEADSARLAEATAAAQGLAAGAAELDAMRAAQRATAERIALLQGLLQARSSPAGKLLLLVAQCAAAWPAADVLRCLLFGAVVMCNYAEDNVILDVSTMHF